MNDADVMVIGAGASGLMAAIAAGKRGRRVRMIDHASRPGQKILMSGGGRCNFTNRTVSAEHYVSSNPHFCKSALSRYTPGDFLALVEQHRIAYEERAHGQLFCVHSARDILDMLLCESRQAGVLLDLDTHVERLERTDTGHFQIVCNRAIYRCSSVIVATGGLSVPAAGASALGYRIAEQFGIPVRPRSAGLVPFTLQPGDKERFATLAGIAVEAEIGNARQRFRENLLFTHRGVSGPAVLQMSLYWEPGETLWINLLPRIELFAWLREKQRVHPRRTLKALLSERLPQRLVAAMLPSEMADRRLQTLSHAQFREVAAMLQQWPLKPGGTEGYRTAEVTLGGVDCDALSSKTMQARAVPGLFFTGEVVDISGRLGGYNLQWAWSSGWCAGQFA
ncbi:MAG: membrane protein [Desulfatitalea sp. BRH_c12]|nr:MAG: membrane protein [Desulfatitalea sp. BRH_c12]